MTTIVLNTDVHSVMLNIIGGAIVVILAWVFGRLYRRFRRCALKRIMGPDFDPGGEYHIVYGSFMLPPVYDSRGQRITHPYLKTPLPPPSPRCLPGASFSIDNPVSGGEMRAAAYLAQFFGRARACAPRISTDNELDARVDLSFISLGGENSNIKTSDAFSHSVNDLVSMTVAGFVSPITNQQVIPFVPNPQFDYGVILRISPSQYMLRTWIVCAGIGEWGTSGASWFLANKWSCLFWHSIKKRKKNFAAIVRVRRGQDESAELIWKV